MTVLGHRGYLGSVVERRWAELGATGDYVVVCLTPEDLPLLRRLAGPGVIVPSSDCVNEVDEYAAGKRAIEQIPGLTVIRSGIVDTRKQYASMFTNWYCNPLTPLEWADLAWELRDQPGVHPAGRESASRFEVADIVHDLWGGLRPRRAVAAGRKDRRQPVDRERPPLREALRAYRDWLG